MGPKGGYIRYPSPSIRISSRALSVDAALVDCYTRHTSVHICRKNPWSASHSVQLPIQDDPSPGMASIHRQPTMTAKLSRKPEQSSSNILFESVSSCLSPLSPGTPFPLRQRQAAKTYTSGQAQSWSLPLPRLANPGARSLSPAPWRCRKIKPYSRNSTNSRCGVWAQKLRINAVVVGSVIAITGQLLSLAVAL